MYGHFLIACIIPCYMFYPCCSPSCIFRSTFWNKKNDVVIFCSLQVISGGNYDVDVVLFDESGKTLYTVQKKQYDSYSFTAQTEGVYKFCFSNEFSTFSHKVVYFDFQAGEETPLTQRHGSTPHCPYTDGDSLCNNT